MFVVWSLWHRQKEGLFAVWGNEGTAPSAEAKVGKVYLKCVGSLRPRLNSDTTATSPDVTMEHEDSREMSATEVLCHLPSTRRTGGWACEPNWSDPPQFLRTSRSCCQNRNSTHRYADVEKKVGLDGALGTSCRQRATDNQGCWELDKQSSSRPHQLVIQYEIVSHENIHISNVTGTEHIAFA